MQLAQLDLQVKLDQLDREVSRAQLDHQVPQEVMALQEQEALLDNEDKTVFQDHQEQLEIRVQRVRPDHKVLKALKDPRASGEKLEAQEPKDELERPENLAREVTIP